MYMFFVVYCAPLRDLSFINEQTLKDSTGKLSLALPGGSTHSWVDIPFCRYLIPPYETPKGIFTI